MVQWERPFQVAALERRLQDEMHASIQPLVKRLDHIEEQLRSGQVTKIRWAKKYGEDITIEHTHTHSTQTAQQNTQCVHMLLNFVSSTQCIFDFFPFNFGFSAAPNLDKTAVTWEVSPGFLVIRRTPRQRPR